MANLKDTIIKDPDLLLGSDPFVTLNVDSNATELFVTDTSGNLRDFRARNVTSTSSLISDNEFTLDGYTVTEISDEDGLSDESSSAVVTENAIKSYVDNSIQTTQSFDQQTFKVDSDFVPGENTYSDPDAALNDARLEIANKDSFRNIRLFTDSTPEPIPPEFDKAFSSYSENAEDEAITLISEGALGRFLRLRNQGTFDAQYSVFTYDAETAKHDIGAHVGNPVDGKNITVDYETGFEHYEIRTEPDLSFQSLTLETEPTSVSTAEEILIRDPSTGEVKKTSPDELVDVGVDIVGGDDIDTSYNSNTDEFTVSLESQIDVDLLTLSVNQIKDTSGNVQVRDDSSGELFSLDSSDDPNSPVVARYEGNNAFTFGRRKGSVGTNSFVGGGRDPADDFEGANEASGDYSFAFGSLNVAKSQGSAVFGYGNTAEAVENFFGGWALGSSNTVDQGIALGASNSVKGTYAVAAGDGNTVVAGAGSAFAGGTGATAGETQNAATGEGAFAWGNENTQAKFDECIAIGRGSVSGGNFNRSMAIGFGLTSTGFDSAAFGSDGTASGDGSVAIASGGSNAEAPNSVAIGRTYTTQPYQVAVGIDGLNSGNNSLQNDSRVFSIGVGDGDFINNQDGRGLTDGMYMTYRQGMYVKDGVYLTDNNNVARFISRVEVRGLYNAPTITKTGDVSGSDQVEYRVLGVDSEGNTTQSSPVASTTIDQSKLDSNNYVTIDWSGEGRSASEWYVVKDIEFNIDYFRSIIGIIDGSTQTFNDTGQSEIDSISISRLETNDTARVWIPEDDADKSGNILFRGDNIDNSTTPSGQGEVERVFTPKTATGAYNFNGGFTFGSSRFPNTTDGKRSFVIGGSDEDPDFGNAARADQSFASGFSTRASKVGQASLGVFNESFLSDTVDVVSNIGSDDRMFAVGVGDYPSASSGDPTYNDGRGRVDGLYVTYRDGTHIRHGLSVDGYNASTGQYETVFEIDETGSIVKGSVSVDGSNLDAAGSDTEIQVNENNNFGSDSRFTYDDSINTLEITEGRVTRGTPGPAFYDSDVASNFNFRATEKSEIPTAFGGFQTVPAYQGSFVLNLQTNETLDFGGDSGFYYPFYSTIDISPDNTQNYVDFGSPERNMVNYYSFNELNNVRGDFVKLLGPQSFNRVSGDNTELRGSSRVVGLQGGLEVNDGADVEELLGINASFSFDNFTGSVSTVKGIFIDYFGSKPYEVSGTVDDYYGILQRGSFSDNLYEGTITQVSGALVEEEDNGHTQYSLNQKTTDGTATTLRIDSQGFDEKPTIPDEGTWHFKGNVTARVVSDSNSSLSTAINGDSHVWDIEGVVSSEVINASTGETETRFIGNPSVVTVATDPSVNDYSVSISVQDDGTFDIEIQGGSGDEVHWVGNLEVDEIIG